jgi:hypothetical protein
MNAISRRLNTIREHIAPLSTLAVQKKYKILDIPLLADTFPLHERGFRLELNVDHDQKQIEFVTEYMSNYEKLTVYLKQKNNLRNIYPDYFILEKHL